MTSHSSICLRLSNLQSPSKGKLSSLISLLGHGLVSPSTAPSCTNCDGQRSYSFPLCGYSLFLLVSPCCTCVAAWCLRGSEGETVSTLADEARASESGDSPRPCSVVTPVQACCGELVCLGSVPEYFWLAHSVHRESGAVLDMLADDDLLELASLALSLVSLHIVLALSAPDEA